MPQWTSVTRKRDTIVFQPSSVQSFQWTQCVVWTTLLSVLTASVVGLFGLATFQTKPHAVQSTGTVRCYQCDNYASVGAEARPGVASGLAWMGGKPVLSGQTILSSSGTLVASSLTALQASRLCSEKVNRTAMRALITSNSYGTCSGFAYDGCAKIVTKSYRVKSQLGRLVLSAVVVSRTCAHVPEGMGVGCFDSVGGAEMRRRLCYCRGDFCNRTSSRKQLVLLIFFCIGFMKLWLFE
ncbi:Palmitoyltransferase [Fasciola gigantica]|uniref:Palmitoyltransferase n=1 Tax=Fasciola gigantica TaxID=46835 RepID=A0A504YNE6_FASGI|nr:Palmitoyltransferase [Fasciola gigantica]